MSKLRPLLIAGLLAGTSSYLVAAEVVKLELKTMTSQMKFDLAEMSVSPGQKVKLVFKNADDMPHNVVFCQPGTNLEELVTKMLEKPEEAMKRGFIPEDSRVWAKSKLVAPQESEEFEFTAPEKPGEYPYACTFPGHVASMKGVLKVLASGPKLTGVKFALYNGAWTKLPDFKTLTPHREGTVDDDIIKLNFDDYKNNYGLVFTGKIKVPADGNYTFYTAADDGVKLSIGDKVVITDDGIHPATIKEKTEKLKAGEYDVRVEYFQAEAGAALYVGWKGANFDVTPWSAWVPEGYKIPAKPANNPFKGIPLVPKQEPIIYRNFIVGGGNRGIGVGFSGGTNFVWSAESFNLELMWRGAFIDAARHWVNRGGGHQAPLGYDILQPVNFAPSFAVLGKEDKNWPTAKAGEGAVGYQWKGYDLDAGGVPTFRYTWEGVEIEERVEGTGDVKKGDTQIVRKLKVTGKIPENACLLLARKAKAEPISGGFLVRGDKANIRDAGVFDNVYQVLIDGAEVRGDLLVAPVKKEMQVIYKWPKDGMPAGSTAR